MCGHTSLGRACIDSAAAAARALNAAPAAVPEVVKLPCRPAEDSHFSTAEKTLVVVCSSPHPRTPTTGEVSFSCCVLGCCTHEDFPAAIAAAWP